MKKVYAVVTKDFEGIVDTWKECEGLVKGVSRARYKSFGDCGTAKRWIEEVKKKIERERFIRSKLDVIVEEEPVEISVDTRGLNEGQVEAVKIFEEFMQSKELCMSLSGYAGTGKTYCLKRINDALEDVGHPVAFIAPTNKACVVMNNNGIDAKTVHKFVYEYKLVNGRYVQTRRNGKEFNHGLIVMDESSMANDNILTDLESYARSAHCKILYVGDPGQLPPVGRNNTRKVFSEFKFRAQLTQVMRQGEGSRILDLATAIRNNNVVIPDRGDKDVCITSSDKAFDNYIQKISEGSDATYICWTNAKRVDLNKRARKALGYEGKPMSGEKFIAINNTERLVNSEEFTKLGGYIGEITIDEDTGYVYKGMRDKEYIIILPEFSHPSFSIPKKVTGDLGLALFDCEHGSHGTYYVTKRNLSVVVGTYAYAITGHKSQGSQWDYVYIDECAKYESVEWLYTVVTRTVKGLVINKHLGVPTKTWNDIETMAYGNVVSKPTYKVEYLGWKYVEV